MAASHEAAERFFRFYHRHFSRPDQDSLFGLLNAAHSLNDQLRKDYQVDFFAEAGFLALKALRNYCHHEAGLNDSIRVVEPASMGAPVFTDLTRLCLVPAEVATRAIERENGPEKLSLVKEAFNWYGSYADINPCLFNFGVTVFEKIQALDIELTGDEYQDMVDIYEEEEMAGRDHRIEGKLHCNAGDISAVLATLYNQAPASARGSKLQ